MAGEWKRGHSARGRGGYRAGPAPLGPPADDTPDDLDDLDVPLEGNPEAYQELVDSHGPPDGSADYAPGAYVPSDVGPVREPGPAPEPVPPDPRPGKVPRARKTRTGRTAAPKITAAVRNDIEGKLGLMLQIGGSAWAARDPVCGGSFLAQLPAVRPAAVDLILLSPDLVVWFTSVGGGFMLWFNLLAALWPTATTVWGHHGPGAGEGEGEGQGEGRAAGPAAAGAYAA